MEQLFEGVLLALPGFFALFLMLVVIPRLIIRVMAFWQHVQVKQQRAKQEQAAHCVEIEARDDGGYSLVPEQRVETVDLSQTVAPQPQGITYAGRFNHSYGIAEEIQLLPDGTFQQAITERSGMTYHNTGSWAKQWSAPFWDGTLGNEVLLKHWADPLEVMLKASTIEIKRQEAWLLAHAFQPQVR